MEQTTTDTCPINRCGRRRGIGTQTRVELPDGATVTLWVCEEHWQALRVILPVDVPS